LTILARTPRRTFTGAVVPGVAPAGSASTQGGGMVGMRPRSSAHCSALPTIVAPEAAAIGTASAAWSKCAWPMKMNAGSSAASSSGEDGTYPELPPRGTQASSRTTCPRIAIAKFVTPNHDRITLSRASAPVAGFTFAAPK
jgi:hypothetical protein